MYKKADYILEHSLISRSEIRISDPDLAKKKAAAAEEAIVVAGDAGTVHAAPPPPRNGTAAPQEVEVEVGTANAATPEPQTAEPVKLKEGGKCKCCSVM